MFTFRDRTEFVPLAIACTGIRVLFLMVMMVFTSILISQAYYHGSRKRFAPQRMTSTLKWTASKMSNGLLYCAEYLIGKCVYAVAVYYCKLLSVAPQTVYP